MFLYFGDKTSVVELLIQAARLYRPGMVEHLAVRFAKQVALTVPNLPPHHDFSRKSALRQYHVAVSAALKDRLRECDLTAVVGNEDALEVAEGVLRSWFKLSPRAVAAEIVSSNGRITSLVHGSNGVLETLPSAFVGYERTVHISTKDDFGKLLSPFCATSYGAALIDPYSVSRGAAGVRLFLDSIFADDSQVANAAVLGMVTVHCARELFISATQGTSSDVESDRRHETIKKCRGKLQGELAKAVRNLVEVISYYECMERTVGVQLVVGPVFGFHDRFAYFSTSSGAPLKDVSSSVDFQVEGGVSLALSTSLNAIDGFDSKGFSIVAPVTNVAMSEQLRLIRGSLSNRKPLLVEFSGDKFFVSHRNVSTEFRRVEAERPAIWRDVVKSAVDEFCELLAPP